jgi:hypothetical protein
MAIRHPDECVGEGPGIGEKLTLSGNVCRSIWQPATFELANIRTLMLWTRNFHLLYCFATWIEPRIRREAAE